ncbi:AMP-binding protein [Marinoscillum sp. MHG1-6]|uniref:AMP-binding protein n=1 Tax=Marinoscillum sp. MHG1-6 TaxID=2959627 RepID=UPI002157D148|nr:AMP-binding protein [Marinoscillum sp. MHG1-6]
MQLNLNGREVILDKVYDDLTKAENTVFQIIKDWLNGKALFSFTTSGSTGPQKSIEIHRSILEYSASCTLDKLDPNRNFKSSLICINPEFIGGFMAIVRGVLGGHSITFMDPQSNPLKLVPNEKFDLVSMVPIQVETLFRESSELLSQVDTVIIGGAKVNQPTLNHIRQNTTTRFYHSYGMTETASHFALQDLRLEEVFEVIGDAKIGKDHDSCLNVKGTVTGQALIQTTDLVDIIDLKHFRWLGRADNIINSGGIKISPELVENILQGQIEVPFFVAGLPDEKLGSKVSLIIESNKSFDLGQFDFSKLSRYQQPKAIISIPKFVYTATEKINRAETLKRLQFGS